jgi:hypothetical protein
MTTGPSFSRSYPPRSTPRRRRHGSALYEKPPTLVLGALSVVDHPKASSSLASAFYKWLQGTAGGVGEFSGTYRLTDVPKFRRVCHRRRSFIRVPRSRILRSSSCYGSGTSNSNVQGPRILLG